jgi:GNAT superfamily N-acetyltransferase
MLQEGWIIRDLNDPDDRPALRDFYERAQDYIILETGLAPSDDTIDELFQNAPPGGDPADCIRLGLFDGHGVIQGVCEQSFGYPNPDSSYLGLLILSSELRGSGYGHILFERMKNTAIKNNCRELFVAVLAPNTRGRTFWERMGFKYALSSDPITTGVATHVRHRLRLDLNAAQTP